MIKKTTAITHEYGDANDDRSNPFSLQDIWKLSKSKKIKKDLRELAATSQSKNSKCGSSKRLHKDPRPEKIYRNRRNSSEISSIFNRGFKHSMCTSISNAKFPSDAKLLAFLHYLFFPLIRNSITSKKCMRKLFPTCQWSLQGNL